jgi:hypothetical protein
MEIPLEWDFLVDFEPTITISLVAGARWISFQSPCSCSQ